MPLDVQRFARIRPYLYHLTARQNHRIIEQDRELHCARRLLQAAGMLDRVATRRLAHLPLTADGRQIFVRDQKPLAAGAIEFEEGWNLDRFVEHVNEHVFFWPGTAAGPIQPGLNHFARYAHEKPVIIRIGTEDVAQTEFSYCRYNSGAPRCSGGKYSPRGSQTYLSAELFSGTSSQVVEVVAKGAFSLPPSTEVSTGPGGPWRPLSAA